MKSLRHTIFAGLLSLLACSASAGQFLAITNAVTDEVSYHYTLTSENFSTLQLFTSTLVVRLDWKADAQVPSIILCATDDNFPSNISGKKRFASKFRVTPNDAVDIEYRPWKQDSRYATVETKCQEIIEQMVSDNAEKLILPTSILLTSGHKKNEITIKLTDTDKANIKKLVQVWQGKMTPDALF